MAIVSLEDTTGTVKVLVFPKVFAQVEPLIEKENLVLVTAKVQHGDTRATKGAGGLIRVHRLTAQRGFRAPAEEPSVLWPRCSMPRPPSPSLGTEWRRRLRCWRTSFPAQGVAKVFFKIGGARKRRPSAATCAVDVSSGLAREVQSLLGPESLVMVQELSLAEAAGLKERKASEVSCLAMALVAMVCSAAACDASDASAPPPARVPAQPLLRRAGARGAHAGRHPERAEPPRLSRPREATHASSTPPPTGTPTSRRSGAPRLRV